MYDIKNDFYNPATYLYFMERAFCQKFPKVETMIWFIARQA
jgi:hypothetical protein